MVMSKTQQRDYGEQQRNQLEFFVLEQLRHARGATLIFFLSLFCIGMDAGKVNDMIFQKIKIKKNFNVQIPVQEKHCDASQKQ